MELSNGIVLEFFAAFILGLILICCILEKNKKPILKNYMYMVVSCMCGLLSEAVSLLLFGTLGIDRYLMVLNVISLISGYALAFFYTRYIASLACKEQNKSCRAVKISFWSGVLFSALLIGGVLGGWLFKVENGHFVHGKFFISVFAYDILACLIGISLIIRYKNRLDSKAIIGLSSFPVFLFLAAVMQYISYGIFTWLFLLTMIAVFIIYLMIQTDINRQRAEQEKQLMNINIAMMRSQIQPHFLYNALSSIRKMIKKDPNVAETAVENFSLYLRQNLESMNRVEPISFDRELKHLEEYIYIEKLRFGDRLCVEYDIDYADFALPVLSLQPIVENAVRHGILKKEEGGNIWIKTRRAGSNVILTVQDDGVGFDPKVTLDDGKTHIGFQNVKNRIEMQIKGTVSVESEIGKGTTVTVTIPLL